MRIVAIDWSGAKSGAEKKIWLAEASGDQLLRLECGRSREQVAMHLIALASEDPMLVAGFDFGFSAPAWFVRRLGLSSAPQLWALACSQAEHWLSDRQPPFWGGGRGPRPDLPRREDHYRISDLALPPVGGIAIKSLFQVGGSGSVGTGSLRGWPVLHMLREAGFAVWPFDAAALPLVVEIYPRLLTGPVNKSRQDTRLAYLQEHFATMPEHLRRVAASSEDAFDAAVSAMRMATHLDWRLLPRVNDVDMLLEGIIWHPALDLDALTRERMT
jgi:hypothetical protein